MGKLRQMHQQLRAVTARQLHEEVMKIILSENEFILDLIREQLQAGEMPDGSQIGVYASQVYANLKGHDYVDLFLTGDLYYSLFTEVHEDKLIIWGEDEKLDDLLLKYGDFLNLNELHRKLLADRVKIKYGEYIKNLIRVK